MEGRMNRLPLTCVLAVLSCAAVAMPAGSATAERVMSGALDICQAIDQGTTVVKDGWEACCAQEVTEYDDGHMDFGDKYCVACEQGTDNCYLFESAARPPSSQDIKKALSMPQKAPTSTPQKAPPAN
jgi:hypothetical protein